MELPNEVKRDNLKALITQMQQEVFKKECLGKMWREIGNPQEAEMHAKSGADFLRGIKSLEDQLEALEEQP